VYQKSPKASGKKLMIFTYSADIAKPIGIDVDSRNTKMHARSGKLAIDSVLLVGIKIPS